MPEQKTIYADYQATTPVDPRVLAAMEPYWRESFGNPHSSEHILGWQADQAVDDAAESVAELIGAASHEILFTSGATEANNLALLGLAKRAPSDRKRILVSAIEHKSVLAAAQSLREREGFGLERIPVDRDGFVRLEVLDEMITDDVLVVSVMAVNNEIGSIQDIAAIASLARESGALVHCDAVQAPCAMKVSDLAAQADLVSLSAHKVYGPKGIGALYVRTGVESRVEPLILGGEQQSGLRAGTVPVPLCVGFGAASSILADEKGQLERARVGRQRNEFLSHLQHAMPACEINGPLGAVRHPGNASVRFPGLSGQDLVAAMQPRIAASTGSACTTGVPETSHVLSAIGLPRAAADSTVRFSFGRFTTEQDIANTSSAVLDAVRRMQDGPAI